MMHGGLCHTRLDDFRIVFRQRVYTDELASARDAAERSVESLGSGARLSAVERTCASAVRFAARGYSGKRPDVIVVAHRGSGSPSDKARLDNAMSTAGGGVPDDAKRGMTGASGTKYRPRAARRDTTPRNVRPLRGPGSARGDGGGGARHTRRDTEYQ